MKLTWKGAVAALVLISGMAWAQSEPAQPAESAAPASSASGKTAPDKTTIKSVAAPDYVIGPDDVLHVAVWKEAPYS